MRGHGSCGPTGVVVNEAHHVEPRQLGGIQQRLALQAGRDGGLGESASVTCCASAALAPGADTAW